MKKRISSLRQLVHLATSEIPDQGMLTHWSKGSWLPGMAYVITIRVFILLAALFDYPTNTNTLTWYSFRSPFKKSQFMVHGSACFFAHTHIHHQLLKHTKSYTYTQTHKLTYTYTCKHLNSLFLSYFSFTLSCKITCLTSSFLSTFCRWSKNIRSW